MSARASKTQNGDLIVTGDLTVLGGINSSTTSKTQKTAETSTVESVKISGDMTIVQEELADISSDNVLSPADKIIAKGKWTDIQAEEPYVLTQAATRGFGLGDTEYDNYLTAYDALDDYITPLLADMGTASTIDGDTFRGYFNDYYETRQALFSAEDQAGDIQSDATTGSGAPRFKFSLLNGDITVLNDDDEEIFAFDASEQTLTVRGTIYAEAGQFAGELNGAYGRLGVFESALLYSTVKTFAAYDSQDDVYEWWKANIDADLDGWLYSVVGTFGTYSLLCGAVDPDPATPRKIYIWSSNGKHTFTDGSSATIGSILTIQKVYNLARCNAGISPTVADQFSFGDLEKPWKYVVTKNLILRDTTNDKDTTIYQDPNTDGILRISNGSSYLLFGCRSSDSNSFMYSPGNNIYFGGRATARWWAAYDSGNTLTTLGAYNSGTNKHRLRIRQSQVNFAVQGSAVVESEIFDGLDEVLPNPEDRCIVSGSAWASSHLYVFSFARRVSASTFYLYYTRDDGTLGQWTITDSTEAYPMTLVF